MRADAVSEQLAISIVDVRPERYAATPTLVFRMRLDDAGGEVFHSIVLRCQIRIEPQRRRYSPAEEARLLELFGETPRWGDTLKPFLWSQVATVVPGFAGEDHAARAVSAARSLIHATGNDDGEPWVPLGIGVHTGVAYVGRVGEGDACDFTAVGDAVNTTARLASAAGAGEVLVSKAAADASMLDDTGLESRTLTLRGKDEMIDALVLAA